MSDIANGQEPTVATPTPDAGNGTQQADMFPRDYVEALRKEAAQYRTKAKELEDAQKLADEAKLAEQQKWQELAEQRAAELKEISQYKTRYEEMLESIRASNQKRVESVPENMRSLIPDYDDPARLSSWLDANAALLSAKPLAPNLNGAAGSGTRPGAAPVILSDDELAIAKKMNLTPEQYAEAKAKVKAR